MWHRYIKYVHLYTEPFSILKVDSVNLHMHLPWAVDVGFNLAEMECVS